MEFDPLLTEGEGAGAFRRLVAERPHDPDSAGRRVAATAEAVASAVGSSPLVHAGDPLRRLDTTGGYSQAVTSYLHEFRAERRSGEAAVFVLAESPERAVSLFYDVEPGTPTATEYVWVSLDDRPGRPGASAALVEPFVSGVAEAFGASSAFVEDELLLAAYRGTRAMERSREALPPELHELVPPAPDIGADLPDLLVPQEFDRHRVPSGIWWINYWSDAQIETLGGRDAVATAPWERVLGRPGGLLLVATADPTDPGRPEHGDRLRALFEQLDLRGAQEQHRT